MEEQEPTWAELDDACVSTILGKLDARSLATIAQTSKRVQKITNEQRLWRGPFSVDYPLHYAALEQQEGLPWRSLYHRRHAAERNWRRGACCGPEEALIAHSGPVFATRFLAPPFPGGLALSGGVRGQNEASEVILWDLDQPREGVGRQGWRLVWGGALDNLCGVFDIKQLPNSPQVLCSGFGSEVDLCTLSAKAWPGGSQGAGPSSGQTSLELARDPGVEGEQQGKGSGGEKEEEERPDREGGGKRAYGEGQAALVEGQACYELRHTHTLVGHDAACPSVACTAEGLAATASFDGSIRLWRLLVQQASEQQQEEEGPTPGCEPATITAAAVLRDPFSAQDNPLFHSNAVCGLALSDDGTKLSSGGNDMQVKQWDMEGGKVSLRLTGHEGWVWHVEALDKGHATLVSGGTDSSVRVWDTRAGGRQVQKCEVCTGTLYPVAGLCLRPPDQRYLACGVFDGSVHVVDRRTMRVLYALEGHSDRVTRVACNGDSILSGSFDSRVNLWSF